MSADQVVVHATPALLAESAAARLITSIVDAQTSRGRASIVLTGGSTGIAVLASVNASPARDAVDWQRVEIWWGDERFVPASDKERNDLQAYDALLGAVPVDPARVHRVPSSDGKFGDDAAAAAAWYADQLTMVNNEAGPWFDVLMLGLGEEGHTASIFPESPAAYDEGVTCAVRDCPKPPPTRVSMTFPTLARADEVWMMTAGGGKADAVGKALGGADRTRVPAAGPKGRRRTLWLLDQAATGS
ncbi:6-phosphogluconolactonase [Antricoccus suffuscus]|uniref:6-phosphogluconolactonase n=1 Tax=Antricoccus suffuscus TaxID=1629062 RepID=A0A2T1A562_9ACTN|nr:6-phosphogluconolactonase [Antricoccus suffuscus]PRZ43726.1 6-phosphogluconolactonase [Antricoccus suffuscus]